MQLWAKLPNEAIGFAAFGNQRLSIFLTFQYY
jgi:hypothetical protein